MATLGTLDSERNFASTFSTLPKLSERASEKEEPTQVIKDFGIRKRSQSIKFPCCVFKGFKSVLMTWLTVNIFLLPLYIGTALMMKVLSPTPSPLDLPVWCFSNYSSFRTWEAGL